MLNQDQHRIHLTNILLGLYRDSFLSQHLGFKGGTAALLFYGLPRFSVDLDFDIIGEVNDEVLRQHIDTHIHKQYEVKDKSHKHFTLFWLLSYGTGEANIKIEVSVRRRPGQFERKILYGAQIPVMVPGDMIAYKLVAIQDRTRTANRDLFDAHYFLSGPDAEKVNLALIQELTGKSLAVFWDELLVFLHAYAPHSLLDGMGELLTTKQKAWAKDKMLPELIGLIERQRDLGKAPLSAQQSSQPRH